MISDPLGSRLSPLDPRLVVTFLRVRLYFLDLLTITVGAPGMDAALVKLALDAQRRLSDSRDGEENFAALGNFAVFALCSRALLELTFGPLLRSNLPVGFE